MITKKNKLNKHFYYMNLALQQAKNMLGVTKENPAVGCVIVKDNHVISVGSTGINGRPHAERNAINYSKTKLNGSELYTTLEPCSHYGKTLPCIKSIIRNRIKKVYFSIKDPDPRSFNKASNNLKKYRIKTKSGLMRGEIYYFYRSYIKAKKDNVPFVTCKLAMSKDYFTINRKKKWITNRYSRGRVHLMRSNHDCLITSSETIIKDNPLLNCRIRGLEKRSPARIIIDANLKVPTNSKIIKGAKKNKTIIFYNKNNEKKIQILKNTNVKLIKMPINNRGYFDLKILLIKIKKLGFSRVFLESGVKLVDNFFRDNLIDDFKLFISSKNLGKKGSGSARKYLNFFLRDKKYIHESVNLFDDKLISYRIR